MGGIYIVKATRVFGVLRARLRIYLGDRRIEVSDPALFPRGVLSGHQNGNDIPSSVEEVT